MASRLLYLFPVQVESVSILLLVCGFTPVSTEVLILFPESVILIFFQAPEHASVIHIVTVDNVVIIRKIRFVKAFQKDTPCDVAVAMQVGSQIFLIVTWIQNRIIDAKFVLIIKPYPSDNIWIFSFQLVKFYFYICSPPAFFLLSYCLLPIMSGSAWTSMKVVLSAGW